MIGLAIVLLVVEVALALAWPALWWFYAAAVAIGAAAVLRLWWWVHTWR